MFEGSTGLVRTRPRSSLRLQTWKARPWRKKVLAQEAPLAAAPAHERSAD
jgi:hypothetical protein